MGDWTGVCGDRFGSADGNTRVGDGSRLVQGVTKDGKAAKDDEGNEKFKAGS